MMSGDTTNWTQLREFSGIELSQSFALSWVIDASTLIIDVDLYLTREHPMYEKPRPAEKACFRPANLEFPECSLVVRDGAECKPADVVTSIPPGRLTGLTRGPDGRYTVNGMFGTVNITSGRLVLRIKDLSV